MSKLLQGRLPFAPMAQNVDGNTFNKAVRLLELSLDSFDPDATPQFTITERDTLKFNAGDVIWNVSLEHLQVYDGNNWVSLSAGSSYTEGSLGATGFVGTVQVVNKGSIVVNVRG